MHLLRLRSKLSVVVTTFVLLTANLAHAAKLSVVSVNYPLTYFTQRIGGEDIDVRFLVPADIDPAFWTPDSNAVNAYQQADIILLNGAGYAKWTKKVSLSRFRLIDTSIAFAPRYIELADTTLHRHGPAGEHSHTGVAFTTWLDFRQAIIQAEAIYQALSSRQPQNKAQFYSRFIALKTDLEKLDSKLEVVAKKWQGYTLLSSHPVYQYLARRYALQVISVQWEPDEYPNAEQWQLLQQLQSNHSHKIMLWEDLPLARTQKQLSALGVTVLVFRPAMNKPSVGDFLTVMRENIKNLNSINP